MDFQYGQDYPDEPWVDRDGRPIDDEHGGAEPTTWEALEAFRRAFTVEAAESRNSSAFSTEVAL